MATAEETNSFMNQKLQKPFSSEILMCELQHN